MDANSMQNWQATAMSRARGRRKHNVEYARARTVGEVPFVILRVQKRPNNSDHESLKMRGLRLSTTQGRLQFGRNRTPSHIAAYDYG